MTHNDIVIAYLLEFAGASFAVVLPAVAILWWRRGWPARRLGPAVAIVMCLASVNVAAHSARDLAHARAELCQGGPPRFLCGGGGGD